MDIPSSLEEVEEQLYQEIHGKDQKELIWKIPLTGKQKTLEVYMTDGFKQELFGKKFAKKTLLDPKQIFKCLRNVQYGFNLKAPKSASGHDGIFAIDLDNKRYCNDMVKVMNRHQEINYNDTYDFFEGNIIPVRVVAHPNKIRVRPVGYIVLKSDIQYLILVDVSIERI